MEYKDLGYYIRNKRNEIGLSLNTFALNNNIEPASLSKFETGKSGVTFETIIKIANGFNKTVGELLSEYEQSG